MGPIIDESWDMEKISGDFSWQGGIVISLVFLVVTCLFSCCTKSDIEFDENALGADAQEVELKFLKIFDEMKEQQ